MLALDGAGVCVRRPFMAKTVTGRAMQAVAQNTESASVLGINVPRMIFIPSPSTRCWPVAAAMLVTPTYLAKFDMGEEPGHQGVSLPPSSAASTTRRGALLGGLDCGRVREPGSGLHLARVQRRGGAGDLHGRDFVQAARAAGQKRGAQSLSTTENTHEKERYSLPGGQRLRCCCWLHRSSSKTTACTC